MSIRNIMEGTLLKKVGISTGELSGKAMSVITQLPKLRTHQERIEFLRNYPDDVLRSIIKVGVYVCLFTGNSAIELLKTVWSGVNELQEVENFMNLIEQKTKRTGRLTYASVSNAVDEVLGVGLVSMDVLLWIASLFNPLLMILAIPNTIALNHWGKCYVDRKGKGNRNKQKRAGG